MAGSDNPTTTKKSRADRLHGLRRHAEHFERSKTKTLPRYMPDPLKDSNRVRATQVKKMLVGLVPRLCFATTDDMQEVIVNLWHGPAADLYSHKAQQRAVRMTAAIVGSAPAWSKLERSHDGWLHVHIITSADAPLLLPAGATTRPVNDLAGLLAYLSKPGDSRAAMVTRTVNGQTRRNQNTDDNKLAALQDYHRARARSGGRPFPRLSWTHNLPRLNAEQKELLATG